MTEEIWSRLAKWQNSYESKISPETYFNICELEGRQPDPAHIPPDLSDFPHDVQQAVIAFGKLGDRVVPDYGYLGKDYTLLPVYIKTLEVDNIELFLETLARLDERLITKSREDIKRAHDALKSKK